MTPKPVSGFEKNGILARTSPAVYQAHMADCQRLHEQHQAYLDSLPTEPEACICAAITVLESEGAYPEGLETAMHLPAALAPMLRALDIFGPSPELGPLLYIADRINDSLGQTVAAIERAHDILGNSARSKIRSQGLGRDTKGEMR